MRNRVSVFRTRRAFVLLIALLSTASFLLAAAEQEIWKRVSQTPVISPQGSGWESAGTFNPAVIRHDNKVVMLTARRIPMASRVLATPIAPTAFTSLASPSRSSHRRGPMK